MYVYEFVHARVSVIRYASFLKINQVYFQVHVSKFVFIGLVNLTLISCTAKLVN